MWKVPPRAVHNLHNCMMTLCLEAEQFWLPTFAQPVLCFLLFQKRDPGYSSQLENLLKQTPWPTAGDLALVGSE